jgi:hypothetical protein
VDPLEDFAHRAAGAEARGRIDVATLQVVGALRAAGVDALVLKGPAIAQWLYDPGEVRAYGDSDILAAPDRFASAGRAMAEAGFHIHADEATHPEVREEGRSQVWHRLPEDVWVDLQWRLPGVGLAPGRAWEILWAGHEEMDLGPGRVPVAGETARALHLTTAAAAADPGARKPIIDLERAIARLQLPMWEAAARLGAELHALPAMRAGLMRAAGDGMDLARRLGV